MGMYKGDGVAPMSEERPEAMFPKARMDGASILRNNMSFVELDKRTEMHVGSSLHIDTGFNEVQPPKRLEKIRTYDKRTEIDMGSPLHNRECNGQECRYNGSFKRPRKAS